MPVAPSEPGIDKWITLDRLIMAAPCLGLSHREIAVLRALVSFHPARTITPRSGAAIVFPSNRTLSKRLGGMPESTLRRHMARLVKLGFVSRHDSANRKRFRAGPYAFGFDLAPLALRAEEIEQAATEIELEAERIKGLRAHLLALRQRLIEQHGHCEITDQIALTLRRKPDLQHLGQLKDQAERFLIPEEMSATPTQNKRHIDTKKRKPSDSVAAPDHAIGMNDIRGIFKERDSYLGSEMTDWSDVVRSAHTLAPMMGIDSSVLHHAERGLGREIAALAVLCILERLAKIRSPGAYLRTMSQHGVLGRTQVIDMIKSLAKRKNCQMTSQKSSL